MYIKPRRDTIGISNGYAVGLLPWISNHAYGGARFGCTSGAREEEAGDYQPCR